MTTVAPFEFRLKEVFEVFEEALDYHSLRYSSMALERFGFQDELAINKAIHRAMLICSCLDIDPKKHFRPYYKVDMASSQASREWRVSKLGFYLVICNGEPANPFVSEFQIEILNRVLPQLI